MKRLSRWASLSLVIACTLIAQAQQRPRISGIAQVRFYTASPAASVEFYEKIAGFKGTAIGASMLYPVNDLQTIEVTPLPSPAPVSRLSAVVLRTTDAAALERYLQSKSVAIAEPLAHGTFGVRDPENNLILFTQAPGRAMSSFPRFTSGRIIHAGFVVHDREAEDHFYRDVLGFHLYWEGGQKAGVADWVAMQVPDGSDWLEYMLNVPANATAHQLGVDNHISLGVTHMSDALAALARNGCTGPECSKSQMGLDGKVQLNLYDPDQTRLEYMEYKPTGTPCCSPITGKAPEDKEDR